MKIKIFSDACIRDLEEKVNEFIDKHDVADIQFSGCSTSFDVMIVYNK